MVRGNSYIMSNRVTEFHNIQPIENVPSILEHGILSFYEAKKLPHLSIARDDIQKKRDVRIIPGGLPLHQYANLYFDARNPMMYRRINERSDLCVLKISKSVDEIENVVFSDQNISSDYVRFYSPEEGYERLNFDLIYAADWRHPNDPVMYFKHRSIKCAEVLIPNLLPPQYIKSIYTSDENMRQYIKSICPPIDIVINPYLFFK
jgi:hypothetical protein